MSTAIKNYFVKVTYFDDTPTDYDEFDNEDEAIESYNTIRQMRCDRGIYACGDIAEVMFGIVQADGNRTVWNRYAFQ